MKLDDLPARYRAQAMQQINDRATRKNANAKRLVRDEPVAAEEGYPFSARVDIRVHHVRKRLADPDNLCIKAVIDALRHTGILQEDTQEFVRSVSHSQEKGKIERTTVTITEVLEINEKTC